MLTLSTADCWPPRFNVDAVLCMQVIGEWQAKHSVLHSAPLQQGFLKNKKEL